MRALWYQYMVAIEDVTTQRRGLVTVTIGSPTFFYAFFTAKLRFYQEGMPHRINAIHYCLSHLTLKPIDHVNLLRSGKDVRTRLRIHVYSKYSFSVYFLVSYFSNELIHEAM